MGIDEFVGFVLKFQFCALVMFVQVVAWLLKHIAKQVTESKVVLCSLISFSLFPRKAALLLHCKVIFG